MIEDSTLDGSVKKTSLDIFRILAEAEAKVHGTTPDEIHFHEVGSVDSIVDIVGAAICLKWLGPDAVYCSPLQLGGGTVECKHGLYPVPAPATAEIVRNMPVKTGLVDYEATTPTGAAIVAACSGRFVNEVSFRIISTGYGIGYRDGKIPNVLRVHLADTQEPGDSDTITASIIECNLDDMNPEFYGFIMDALFQAGAMDVYITPLIMKKTRPAAMLSVLCGTGNEESVMDILFRETSTVGLRKYRVEKTMLHRTTEELETPFGKVRVKSAWYRGKCIKKKPEYEDCILLARQHHIPLSRVYREVEQLIRIPLTEYDHGRQV
jgi:hypothetical protein